MNKPTAHSQRAATRTRWQRAPSALSVFILLLLLGACDGGIFGTGDGSDIVSPVEADGSESGEGGIDAGQPPVSEPDDADNGDEGTEAPDGTVDEFGAVVRAFENLDAGSERSVPLLSLINLSQLSLNAFTPSDNATLFDSNVDPGNTSPHVVVPLGSPELNVVETLTSRLQLRLSPLNLGSSSVTTLIARDRFQGTRANAPPLDPENAAVDVLALASQLTISDDGLVRVRIVQAYAIGDQSQASEQTLVPSAPSPGGSEISLGTVSPETFLQPSAYRAITAGSYQLQDGQSRFEPLPLVFESGHAYTLIITGTPTLLQVVQDSDAGD